MGVINLVSIGTALAMALGAGTIIYAAASAASFTQSVVLYHGIVYAVFFGLYLTIPGGFRKHFRVADDIKGEPSAGDVAYYTMITHSGVGYGDMYPQTTAARVLVATHIFFAILAIFNMVPIGKSVFSYASFDR